MRSPLYKELEQQAPHKTDQMHKGLWFDRFFNRYNDNWQLGDTAKQQWIKEVVGSTGNATQLDNYAKRQMSLVRQLQGMSQAYTTDWNFVTGMGNAHPVENGFSWHPTLAVPYLSGASVKGLIRAWVEINEDKLDQQRKQARLKSWFGTEDKKDIPKQAGDFIFFDALPDKSTLLACDIMTPHMGKWYSDGATARRTEAEKIPADWHTPNPIHFLVVKKASFIFHIAARKAQDQEALKEIFKALSNALEWLGAGAKTGAGYGYMTEEHGLVETLKSKLEAEIQEEIIVIKLAEQLKNASPLAEEYFTQAAEQNWDSEPGKFLQQGLIEEWLSKLEATPEQSILGAMEELLQKHLKTGIFENPDATKGKKKKAVYSDRQRDIVRRFKALQDI